MGARAWAAWRVSFRSGGVARRSAGVRISGWQPLCLKPCWLGAGFGRSVQSRSTWLAARVWWAGRCVMRRVRVQPGCGRVQPCSIARFGDSCRGRRDGIAGLQWSVAGGQWPVVRGRERQWPMRAGRARDRLAARKHGGVVLAARWRRARIAQARRHHFPVADTRAGDAPARWHRIAVAGTPAGIAPARGIAPGGRCGGSPPAQGRAGTARPSNASGQLSVASCHLSVVSDRGLQGV